MKTFVIWEIIAILLPAVMYAHNPTTTSAIVGSSIVATLALIVVAHNHSIPLIFGTVIATGATYLGGQNLSPSLLALATVGLVALVSLIGMHVAPPESGDKGWGRLLALFITCVSVGATVTDMWPVSVLGIGCLLLLPRVFGEKVQPTT